METFLEDLPLAKDKLLGMTEEDRLTVAMSSDNTTQKGATVRSDCGQHTPVVVGTRSYKQLPI